MQLWRSAVIVAFATANLSGNLQPFSSNANVSVSCSEVRGQLLSSPARRLRLYGDTPVQRDTVCRDRREQLVNIALSLCGRLDLRPPGAQYDWVGER